MQTYEFYLTERRNRHDPSAETKSDEQFLGALDERTKLLDADA
jgi:hypothetical protein